MDNLTHRMAESLKDIISTFYIHSLGYKQGDYRLVNDGEIEQAINRAENLLDYYRKAVEDEIR